MANSSDGFLELWVDGATVRRAIKVAIIVGTILCLINQWQAIIQRSIPIDWFKVVLTYLVPYAVSSYSTVASKRDQQKPDRSN